MSAISPESTQSQKWKSGHRTSEEQAPVETARPQLGPGRRLAGPPYPGAQQSTCRTLYDCPRISHRTMATLFTSQSLAQAAFIACGTVSALVGFQLGGSAAWAGVPSATLRLAGAFAAPVVAALTERIGRRRGLALALAAGVLGAGMAGEAIAANAFLLFLGALVLMGFAFAAMLLERFAAAEVTPPQRRGWAISMVVVAGAAGSVAGPLLVGPSGRWAVSAGLDELVGPYVVALLILAAASLSLLGWLRPDPRDVGRKMAVKHPEPTTRRGPTRSLSQILRTPGAALAVAAMVLSQWVMVMFTVITSVYMKNHQHTLTDLSLVVAAQTLGMFAFSFVPGRLADRWGRAWVLLAGAVLLVLACILAPFFSATLPLAATLLLLGLGWNFCFVGGSALLFDQLAPAEQAKTQGANELFSGLISAIASLGGGVMFAATSYRALGAAGALVSLVLVGCIAWWMARGELLVPARQG